MMEFIKVKLIIEDVNNLSNDDAIRTVQDIIGRAFKKEEEQQYPRVKLAVMDIMRVKRVDYDT